MTCTKEITPNLRQLLSRQRTSEEESFDIIFSSQSAYHDLPPSKTSNDQKNVDFRDSDMNAIFFKEDVLDEMCQQV